MYCIETESLKLKLEIVPVASLIQHEEILPQVADKLMLELEKQACIQDPIIVDENHIVLDGNHRAFVFKKLKLKYIPVCKVDYFSEACELRYWFRLLGNMENLDLLKQTVEELKGEFRPVPDVETLRRTLEENRFCCGIQQDDFFAIIHFPGDVVSDSVSAYALLEEIQTRLMEQGTEVEYIPCQSVNQKQFCEILKEGRVVIWTPRITKEMVIDAVGKKKLFAPKSTRQCIPARPLSINVPLEWLKEDIPLEEINERFMQFLEGKSLKHFGPGQVISGRFYEEELFVFVDDKGEL